MSSKAEILAAAKFREERVEVGGVSFKVREFSGAERDAYEQGMVTRTADGKREANMTNMRAKLVAPSLVSDEGERDFDVDFVAALPASMLDPLFAAAQRVNGLGAEAVDTAVKNSEGAPSASSTSDSPSP